MSGRAPFAAGALAACLLAYAPWAAAGETGPRLSAEEAAKRWVQAFRGGEQESMDELAGDRRTDPFPVVDWLMTWHERGAAADPPKPRDHLAAAKAFAERVADRPDGRGLPRLVAEWTAAPKEQWDRDWALRIVSAKTAEAEREKAWADLLGHVEKADADLSAARASGATAALHGRRARALAALGRADEAVVARRAAIAVSEDMRWPRGKAYHLRQWGELEGQRRRHAASAAVFEEALAVSEAFGTAHEVAWTRMELAHQYAKSGRVAAALSSAEAALGDPDGLGEAGVGRTRMLLGDLRRDLGRHAEARDHYDRARPAFEAAGLAHDATLARFRGGEARLRLLDFVGAEERFRLVIAEGEGKFLVGATLQLGCAVRGRGAFREAAEIHARTVEAAKAANEGRHVGLALAALGADRVKLAEWPAAIEAFEAALESAKANRVPVGTLGSVHRQLAEAYRRADRPRDAVRTALEGAALRRSRALDLGEAFGDEEQRLGRAVAEEGILAAVRWAALEPASRVEATAAAFALSEAARGALLADAIADERRAAGAAPAEDDPRLVAARARFDAAQRRVLEVAFGAAPPAEDLAAARREYDAASDARREAEARADLARRGTERPASAPIAVDAARASVPDGGCLVLYTVTSERIVAVAVTQSGADLLDLGDSKPVVESAKAWLAAVATPAGDEGAHPETLYAALLAPLEPRLKDGATLLVGRDGDLSHLPFEALAKSEGGRRRRAVESWTIAYVPSATVHAALGRGARVPSAREAVIVLGDPVYPGEAGGGALARARGLSNLDRLPGSAEEAREVAAAYPAAQRTLLLRGDATRARLTAAIEAASGGIRLLHVACHGFADERLPGRSGLVLSGADVWTADDVRATRVPADLVVLSACESGGGPTRRGEGVLALARAFLEAGASRVVAADRALGDDHARDLLRGFYAALREGRDPAAALRAAKLSRIRAGGAAAHPSAWSALVLWE